MDKNRLYTLLKKYQDNSCTPQELNEIEQWYNDLNTGNQPIEYTDEFANEMFLQFRQKLQSHKQAIPLYKRKFFRVAAAAAVVILIATTVLFVIPKQSGESNPVSRISNPDISAPNSTKAYITLSDGRKVYLDEIQNGTIAREGSVIINKQGDQVVYTSNQQPATSNVSYNTITVPKGSKPFKLLLADGSEMWLDAATTIKYPNAFVGKERKVEIITGQAYFEVSHNASMPFIAKKGTTEVQVLGTHFNVSAFDNEVMKVTLLEGSVKVKSEKLEAKINPGQQAVLTPDSRLQTLNSVDIEAVMAWKNGNFQFEAADINAVMKQLARWYDVEVEIKGNIPDHFGGTISRDVNVSKVFEMLKLTGAVNYKIDGRKIIVTP